MIDLQTYVCLLVAFWGPSFLFCYLTRAFQDPCATDGLQGPWTVEGANLRLPTGGLQGPQSLKLDTGLPGPVLPLILMFDTGLPRPVSHRQASEPLDGGRGWWWLTIEKDYRETINM